jgi:hypothetical protein
VSAELIAKAFPASIRTLPVFHPTRWRMQISRTPLKFFGALDAPKHSDR